MPTATSLLTADDWSGLTIQAQRLHSAHLRDLLGEPGRTDRMTITGAGLTADFAKQRLDGEAIDALFALGHRAGLVERRQALFAGEIVNPTEHRPALHMALRGKAPLPAIGNDVAGERARIRVLASALRDGKVKGSMAGR